PGVTGGRRGRILADAGFASGTQTRPSNPIERRQDQERDGVEAEVIYGIIGISRGLFTHSGIADHETLAAVYRAYNDYIADFNRSQPGRFFGLGCLPNHDARAAADEVRHCAELGLRGAVFVPWGSALPVWHQMWEPLWTAAEETGLVISFHVFEGGAATVGYAVQNIQHPASPGPCARWRRSRPTTSCGARTIRTATAPGRSRRRRSRSSSAAFPRRSSRRCSGRTCGASTRSRSRLGPRRDRDHEGALPSRARRAAM